MSVSPAAVRSTEVRSIVELGNAALAIAADDVEQFTEKLDRYLEALELWKNKVTPDVVAAWQKEAAVASVEEFRVAVSGLNELHSTLSHRAADSLDAMARQLGENHKRVQALRAYLDRYPARISITGKREG